MFSSGNPRQIATLLQHIPSTTYRLRFLCLMRNFHTLFLPYGLSVYFLCTVAENTVTQLQPAQYAAWLSGSVLFPPLLSPCSFPLAYSVSVLLCFGLWKTWVKPSQYFRQFVVFEVPEGWTFVRGGKVFGIYKNIPLGTNKVTWTILIAMRGMYPDVSN